MKLLVYASTGFLQRTDPDFQREWAREGDNCVVGYWNMAVARRPAPVGERTCCLGWSASWTSTVWTASTSTGGYVANAAKTLHTPADDEVLAFEETPENDGAFTDLLAVIYAEVKRRGGILKVHRRRRRATASGGLKVYDYLWVGEGVGQGDELREAVKNHPPYVVPCIDQCWAQVTDEDELYLHAIPYMQFPVLLAGRPFTGRAGPDPGRRVPAGGEGFLDAALPRGWKPYQEHPDGPHSYGGWDRFPGSRRDSAHARTLAFAVFAPGGGGDLGLAGDRRLGVVHRSAATRRGGLGVRQSRVVPGVGQLRPIGGVSRDRRRLRPH